MADRVSHDAAILGLARSFQIEVDEVIFLYESVLTEMGRGAIISDFLPIFAARRVKEMLLQSTAPAGGRQEKGPSCPCPVDRTGADA